MFLIVCKTKFSIKKWWLYSSLDFFLYFFFPWLFGAFSRKKSSKALTLFVFQRIIMTEQYRYSTKLYFACTNINLVTWKVNTAWHWNIPASLTTALSPSELKRLLLFSGRTKPISAMAWLFSGAGIYLVCWWRTFSGPPATTHRVQTGKTVIARGDEAHMQPVRRHHAGAKWHFNTCCVLGV